VHREICANSTYIYGAFLGWHEILSHTDFIINLDASFLENIFADT